MVKNKNYKMAEDIIEVYKAYGVFNYLASNANCFPYNSSVEVIADVISKRGEDFEHDRYKEEV